MKLKLTDLATEQLRVLYIKLEESDYEYYENTSDYDKLLMDAELYAGDAYEENEFDDLEDWCNEVKYSEYDEEYLVNHPNAVKDKIDLMISKKIIELVD